MFMYTSIRTVKHHCTVVSLKQCWQCTRCSDLLTYLHSTLEKGAQQTYTSGYVEIKCQLDATDDFYCRSYCLFNMFRAPLCPSSGAREYYTSGCCLSYLVLGFQVVSMVWSWGLCVRFAGCCSRQQPGSNHLYNTLVLLMMGIMVPETCWASNKICNKNHLLHLVGILFPHINNNARSKPH